MKYVLHYMIVAVLALVGASCVADAEEAERVANAWNAAIEDGTVTEAEATAFVALIRENWPAETDWKELAATGVASVVASFLGINAYRNRKANGSTMAAAGDALARTVTP